MDDNITQSISKAGIIFIVYLFIVVIAFFALSPVIEAIFGAFQGRDFGVATSQMNNYLPGIMSAMTLFLALFISAPIAWFIMWVFHREPAEYYNRLR